MEWGWFCFAVFFAMVVGFLIGGTLVDINKNKK